MKKKILVLGKGGMLGHVVYDYLFNTKKYKVNSTDRKNLDVLKDEKEIERVILDYSPDYIINCIGLINRYANSKKNLARRINSVFPHLLAYLGIKNNWKVIHISSDCYLDKDIYGKSKYLGEINDRHNLTIRTSIIGPEIRKGFGLFHWFMTQEKKIKGFKDVYWDGVTTLQLSNFIEKCIDSENYHGIIDYRTKESTNKYDLLKLISRIFNKKIEILKERGIKIDKRNLNADEWCLKNYESQLIDLKKYIKKNKGKYPFDYLKNLN